MSMTQDTQTPQWHRAGYANYRVCQCTDGHHREFTKADEIAAVLTAQQQRIQALEKSLDQTARESELHKLTARHWKGEARKLGSTKATWELDPDQPLEVRIEALEAALRRVHCYRNGYCRDCGEFTGWDAIQEIQGDEPHAQYCHIGRELALLSSSEAI